MPASILLVIAVLVVLVVLLGAGIMVLLRVPRNRFNLVAAIASFVLALVSLVLGLYSQKWFGAATDDHVGKFVVGFWVIFPPVYFWLDWSWLCRDVKVQDKDSLAALKHTHDLSRNVWLAFVVVLALLFGWKLPSAQGGSGSPPVSQVR